MSSFCEGFSAGAAWAGVTYLTGQFITLNGLVGVVIGGAGEYAGEIEKEDRRLYDSGGREKKALRGWGLDLDGS